MRPGTTRRGFMRETSITAALSSLSMSGTARAGTGGTAYLCVTCGTQFPESRKAAGPLRNLRRRAPVRRTRRPGVDDARTPPDDPQKHDQERRRAPLFDQHRAEDSASASGRFSSRPRGATCCGTAWGSSTTRRFRASRSSAGSPRSRSRTRTITRRWWNGAAPSATHRSTSTKPSVPG